MDNRDDATQTSLRNIKQKSCLARGRGARLNFSHLIPSGAVQHVGELNDLLKWVDLQIVAVFESVIKSTVNFR
jgi:hypothetical protein